MNYDSYEYRARAEEATQFAADTATCGSARPVQDCQPMAVLAVHRAVERRPTILKVVPGKPHSE